ncbi:uncharacterized protein [Bemisia tabaci]|uniref:uncharacterized protein n=1 Tax=Bemisia tabaci TaxID=7038 RepID=UPI003B287037
MIISGLFFYILLLGWFAYPIYAYWSMYPHVDYSQLHLFYGDQDFSLERSQYFWYLHGVSFISACFMTTVTLLHYALPIRAFMLIETQAHVLSGSLRATAAALNRHAMSHRVQFKLPATEHNKTDRYARLRNNNQTVSPEAFPLRTKEASENARPKNFLGFLEDYQNTGGLALRYCIFHHQKILRLLKQLKYLLAPVLFLKVLSSIVSFTNLIVIIATGGTHIPKLLLYVTSAVFLINLVLSILYLSRLRDACRGVSDAALELVRHRHIPRKDLLIIINRSLKEETFSCFLTSALSFKDLYRLLDFSWNYFTIAEAIARKRPENSSSRNSSLIPNFQVENAPAAYG